MAKNSHNQKKLQKWIASQKIGKQFISGEICKIVKLDSNYIGNACKFIPGVKRAGTLHPGDTALWEVVPI